ncbi:hypothetical protein [Flavobacterium sp. MDT1-60]|uniref:hypothetical protein n=1 Tax=Flavobacterium sp. MDT1-60 TaxID=1979344 RepID=UPI00178447F7|nr:hypothetical protein [Flavobacterium sp. MDT1-60]QOG04434.1 hypothetical protein IHE43_09585 [Flavobacterium sp. MDT1-60]
MKKYFLLFLVLIFISCNSSEDTIKNANTNTTTEKNLEGRWLCVSTTGGFGGPTQATLNEKKEIEFSGSILRIYINGKLSREQQFLIKTKPSIFGGEKEMLVIDKGLSITQEYFIDRLIEINGENLILTDECFDCSTSKYVRVK